MTELVATKKEVVHRITFRHRGLGENYTAFRLEADALDGIARRMTRTSCMEAVLTYCERDAGTWDNERVVRTRRFGSNGKEVLA